VIVQFLRFVKSACNLSKSSRNSFVWSGLPVRKNPKENSSVAILTWADVKGCIEAGIVVVVASTLIGIDGVTAVPLFVLLLLKLSVPLHQILSWMH
jgi:hypothetical protein